MGNHNYIELTASPGRDSFYLAVAGRRSNHVKVIGQKALASGGFELLLVSPASRDGPRTATLHHYPTGSTVFVYDGLVNSSARVFGNRKIKAARELTDLARKYEFELKGRPCVR